MTAIVHKGVVMDFMDKLVTGIGNHLSTGIGTVIGAFIMYAAAQTVKFIRSYKRRNTVEYQIKRALKVHELLTEARLTWNADRVYVFQFSNGTYYSNNVSQLNMTCTHQSVAPGVAPVAAIKTEYVVTQYPEMFSDFINHNCVFKDIDEIEYPTMRAILQSQGVKTFLATSFSCPTNPAKIEGFIGIDYMHRGKDTVPEEVCRELNGFAERIGAELRS